MVTGLVGSFGRGLPNGKMYHSGPGLAESLRVPLRMAPQSAWMRKVEFKGNRAAFTGFGFAAPHDPRYRFSRSIWAPGQISSFPRLAQPRVLRKHQSWIHMRRPRRFSRCDAFVDIGVKQDGLVHVSEIAHKYITDPNEVLKLNQKVTVLVTEVDVARKRIALSIKRAQGATDSKEKPQATLLRRNSLRQRKRTRCIE